MTIARVQTVRKIVLGVVLLIGLLVFTVTASSAPSGTTMHKMVEWLGVGGMMICIFGRCWCTMYIGGRKVEEFVTEGPYSVTRNPLYLFSVLGAAGAGGQLGSVVVGLVCGALAWIVFYVVVLHEERLLAARYPAEFAAYKASVPRFWPNPWLWRDAPTLSVAPGNVLRTFADALILLLAVPFAELIDILQDHRILPVLFHLP
jgi:protein-S-isoprenylcysteine O-methyltransferase Ste14